MYSKFLSLALQMLGVLVLRTVPLGGWTGLLQEGRSMRRKSDLARPGLQHPLGNRSSCSIISTNETLVPRRTWVKTVAETPSNTHFINPDQSRNLVGINLHL